MLKRIVQTVLLSYAFQPPSGGCVLKHYIKAHDLIQTACKPAAFGRLCVETLPVTCNTALGTTSRLRAAVC